MGCTLYEAQGHHYLAATGLRLAILLNPGWKSLQLKRIIRQKIFREIREVRGSFLGVTAQALEDLGFTLGIGRPAHFLIDLPSRLMGRS